MKKNLKKSILNEQIILHLPHTSLEVPDYFMKKLLIPQQEFNQLNIFHADLKVDQLVKNIQAQQVIFQYSRLFCDVERFEDETIEPMAKKGMGIVYTKTVDGKRLIKVSPKYKKHIIDNYYQAHHLQLNQLTKTIIAKYNQAYIFDLHSFSDDLVKLTFGYDNTPDICIGIDSNFADKHLTKQTIDFFTSKGYGIAINFPYAGTLIPSNYYFQADSRVKGLMLEINKRIYLHHHFQFFQNILEEYFASINEATPTTLRSGFRLLKFCSDHQFRF